MPPKEPTITWRNSIKDLATDICGVLEPVQAISLARELKRVVEHDPLKFSVRNRIALGARFRWYEQGAVVFEGTVTELRETEAVAKDRYGAERRFTRADLASPSFERLSPDEVADPPSVLERLLSDDDLP